MITITVFVADVEKPSPLGATALQRAQAALRRLGNEAELQVLALDSERATELGVAIEPTVMVGDLVLTVGQAPAAGHLLRAVETARQAPGTV